VAAWRLRRAREDPTVFPKVRVQLMPGSEDEAAELLDTYLTPKRERDEDAARSAGEV
jgi:hypothetical protein